MENKMKTDANYGKCQTDCISRVTERNILHFY